MDECYHGLKGYCRDCEREFNEGIDEFFEIAFDKLEKREISESQMARLFSGKEE